MSRPKKYCTVEGCDNEHSAKGFCRMHYRFNEKWGSPDPCSKPSLIERLLGRVQPVTESGCWLWTGAKDIGDYGIFYINNKRTRAHRFFYEHYNGPIPEGLWVLHKCHTPPCVNPHHLYAGTNSDNQLDMHRAGRGKKPHTCVAAPEILSRAPYCSTCGRFMPLALKGG